MLHTTWLAVFHQSRSTILAGHDKYSPLQITARRTKLRFSCWVLLPTSCRATRPWLEWTCVARRRLLAICFSVKYHWWRHIWLGRKRQTIKAKAALWVITVYNVVTCTLRHNISFWKILNISISRQSKAECGRTELRHQCHIELFVPSSTGGTVPVLFHMKYFMYLLILRNRIISQNTSYPSLIDYRDCWRYVSA